jgi:hypothetical protein
MPVIGLKLSARRSSGESSSQLCETADRRFCSKVEGKIFSLEELQGNEVPFVPSGSPFEALPPDLRSAPFIPEPSDRRQIERILYKKWD